MTELSKKAQSSVGDTAAAWWRRNCDPVLGDPATRARLRRCRSAQEAITIPAAIALARRLAPAACASDERVERALGLTRVLAHVTRNVPERAMRAAGWQSFPSDKREVEAASERPRLSEARFRRLLLTGRGEELVTAFTRLLALLGGETNVRSLAEAFWYWDDKTKRCWAFDYYAASVAAPADTVSSTASEGVN